MGLTPSVMPEPQPIQDALVQQGQQGQQQQQPPSTGGMFGPNNETLPDKLQKCLWNLLIDLEKQDDLARRREIRNIVQRRLFFRGDQYWWWSERFAQFYPPNIQPNGTGSDEPQELPAFQHVTNIFQPFSLSLMSVLSQNRVPTQFFPQSPRDQQDTSTAKSANKVIDVIHRNNDMDCRADDASFGICVDGFIGAYVRYVSDGERFGYDQQPVIEPVDQQIDPQMDECPQCGWVGPVSESPLCPECGGMVQPVPPQTVTIPQQTGTEEIPRGQEVISIVPALNLKRTMSADQQCDFLYLTWVDDLHRYRAMSYFPQQRDKLKNSDGYDSGLVGEASERWARRMLYSGGGYTSAYGSGYMTGTGQRDMGTRRRAWIRPCAFEGISNDEERRQVQALFPHGAYVQFYNDVYCESRDEDMDSRWETFHSMPGEGQVRETPTSALVPIQEQVNDSSNMIFEQGMYGTPEKIIDQNIINPEARKDRVALPGQETFVDLRPNDNISNHIHYSAAVEPSITLDKYRQELFGPIAQFVTGVFPALFGGDTGGNDTKGGIQIQRNQALGRVSRIWRRLQMFWANLDAKSVQCFAKNRSEDVEIAVLGDGGEFESDWIRLADIQGNLSAYPETDQQFPVFQSEIRSLMLQLMSMNPELVAILFGPDNADYTFQEIGLRDIKVPGESQRKKTYKDIEQLVNSAPLLTNGLMTPSIVPDEIVDQLPVALETARQWLLSDAGQAAKHQHPQGYLNVRAYAEACDQMARMRALRDAVTMQATQAGAGNPNPPQHSSPGGVNSNGADGESKTGTESPNGPASDTATS